jgi:hypothetical protein
LVKSGLGQKKFTLQQEKKMAGRPKEYPEAREKIQLQVNSQSLERFEQARKRMQNSLPKSLRALRISKSDAFRALVEFYLDDDEPITSQEYFKEDLGAKI